jgi:small subunit ribosomal protein S1
VLELDIEKRRLKLGIKQMAPTSIDEYLSEHKQGDIVSGRVVEVSGGQAQVELGEGIRALCRVFAPSKPQAATSVQATDLATLSSMLQARWKSGARTESPVQQEIQPGQVRSFRIGKIDPTAKKIEIEPA